MRYTAEQKQWCIENIANYENYGYMADGFNGVFSTHISKTNMAELCNKCLNLKRPKNSGQFCVGAKPKHDIGTEVESNGYVYIKISDTYHTGRTTNQQHRENWVEKHRHLYEKQHGKIKSNNIVIFLDGDRKNFDINNLYQVPRSIHATMCSNGWYKSDRELTLAALKLCELAAIIK